jgi:hypothetical protein
MILTTHAVAGALIGAVAYQNPAFAVAAALISHPLLDTIPHWDYHLSSTEKDPSNSLNDDINVLSKNFIIDLFKIGFDFCLGLALSAAILFLAGVSTKVFLISMICALVAIAPDPLQFVYWKTRSKIIEPFQRFHIYLHAKTKLNDRPVLGILCQVAIISIILISIYHIA